MQVGGSSGGRGALPILAILAPIAAALTVARHGRRRTLGFLSSPFFLLGVLPYVALTFLLPVLGVMFNGYAERTLLSITDATTALAFLVVGAAMSSREPRSWSRWLLACILLQFTYAEGQALYSARGPGWELFAPFHQWDLSLVDLTTFVQARSSGLYLNPNELGLWAGVAIILVWTMVQPRFRVVGILVALLTLLLSQSRGAAVGLAAALLAGAALSVAHRRISLGALRPVLPFGLGGALALAAAIVVDPTTTLGDRFGALFQVLTQGPAADANLAGRLNAWAAVLGLNSSYPWGTWGPPEVLLGTAIDSSWFAAFAQGSVVYVAALALLLLASLAVAGGSKYGLALRLVTVLVAVAGLTQTPFSYPVIAIYWVLLGACLQSSVIERLPPSPIHPCATRTASIAA